MSMHTIKFDIKPMAKGRPRFSGHAYTPKETRLYEQKIRAIALESGVEALDGDLGVRLIFVYTATKKVANRLQRHEVVYKESRPDIDNLCKGVLDALNGVLYQDDSRIVNLSAVKVYGYSDCIYLVIWNIRK